MSEIKTQTLIVPFATMNDYYRKQGFRVNTIRLGYKDLGIHNYRKVEDDFSDKLQDKYPNAQRGLRVGDSNNFHYYDLDTVDHLEVDLVKLEDNNEKDNL